MNSESNVTTTDTAIYKDSSLSIQKRLDHLLSLMTVEEKAAQMVGVWNEKADTLLNANGEFDLEKAKDSYSEGHGLGQVGRPNEVVNGKSAREIATLTNEIQKFFMEHSRLGIPVIFHEECLHGLAATNATSFPQPIAMAGTFNPDLIESMYGISALEARVRGGHQALTPVVDIARDPRWGRVEETFGEDPYLVGRMGVAAVKGFQGDASFSDKKRVLATLKHFAAHGDPEAGMNCAPVNVSMRELREVFLPPFKNAIDEAGVISVMASYNEIDGVPSHANKWLLQDLLRDEWGFEGFVVSDYYAIWELSDRPDTHGHHIAKDGKEAAKLAIEAGVNIELPEPNAYKNIVELVSEGALKESRLDEMVRPMLYWKFKLGLFDDPFVDPEEAEKISGAEEHRDVAKQAASESVTLLKNNNDILPLDKNKIKKMAVIGPNVNRSLLGGYSGRPVHESTFLDGIKEKVNGQFEVVYSEGCKITIGGSWEEDEVVLADPEENRKLIEEAKETAKDADVIVLAIGGNDQTSRESWALNHMGDRTNLEMVGQQNELVQAMVETGKPVVAFLFNGKPLAINDLNQHADAILECWYIGQETGNTVADILFGDLNPGGKLPISFPRSVGHIPAFYNHKPSARRGYLFDDASPLFPFGFGLSYTTFSIGDIKLNKSVINPDESTEVSVDVTNTGSREGTEVVQLYIRDKVSSVTRPVKELKGFKKIWLKPGETKTVTLEITPSSLAFYDIHMDYTVEPGEFDIMIGNSSDSNDLKSTMLTVN
ncbi:glycoside hydrolase family 3 N-terminal domain-containing protein [Rhodohalobacter sp. 8-1]|uniref:glycoside hydrolase family 3 N-terminal domain-containing protein n=1 Tax=Rhodohalobacter sp. 8-1 TaxID=3131972 RepID=UPI0030EE71BC